MKTVYPPHTKFAWGIMIVLTGVNFADKENMYKQTKNSLIKFMGGLTEEEAETGQDPGGEMLGWNQLGSLFVCFSALRPKSTAMVIAGRSVHLTTLFPGQA